MQLVPFPKPPAAEPTDDMVQVIVRAFTAPPWSHGYAPESARKILKMVYDYAHFYGVLVREDDVLAGMAFAATKVCPTTARPFFAVNTLCVDPAFHGRGLGRGLLNNLIEEARSRDLSFVQLYTMRGKESESAAERLYTKAGFRDAPLPPQQETWRDLRLDLTPTRT